MYCSGRIITKLSLFCWQRGEKEEGEGEGGEGEGARVVQGGEGGRERRREGETEFESLYCRERGERRRREGGRDRV